MGWLLAITANNLILGFSGIICKIKQQLGQKIFLCSVLENIKIGCTHLVFSKWKETAQISDLVGMLLFDLLL